MDELQAITYGYNFVTTVLLSCSSETMNVIGNKVVS